MFVFSSSFLSPISRLCLLHPQISGCYGVWRHLIAEIAQDPHPHHHHTHTHKQTQDQKGVVTADSLTLQKYHCCYFSPWWSYVSLSLDILPRLGCWRRNLCANSRDMELVCHIHSVNRNLTTIYTLKSRPFSRVSPPHQKGFICGYWLTYYTKRLKC